MTDERIRILITGSRNWSNPDTVLVAIHEFISTHGAVPYTVVHGGATGVDSFADHAATVLSAEGHDIIIEEHPAHWKTLGRAAGVLRNQHMVNLGADVCLSFNRNNSNGTRHCTDAAQRAGIPVRQFTE